MASAKRNSKKKGEKESISAQGNDLSQFDLAVNSITAVVLFLSILAILSIVSYYSNWAYDYSYVTGNYAEGSTVQVANVCSTLGAKVSHWLIGASFGAFGFLVPLFAIYVSFGYLFKSYRVRVGYMAALTMTLLFMTSATLGAMFGTKWDLYNSGLGGAYGLEITRFFVGQIGFAGYVVFLLFSWCVTGILINRNFVYWMRDRVERTVVRGAEACAEIFAKFQQASVSKNLLPQSTTQETEDGDYGVYETSVEPEVEVSAIQEFEIERGVFECAVAQEEYEAEVGGSPVVVVDATAADAASEMVGECIEDGVEVKVEANTLQVVSEEEAEKELYDPMKDLYSYVPPPVSLLEDYQSTSKVTQEEINENTTRIKDTLSHFGVEIREINATVGPTITLYEIVQAEGVKISKIKGLEDDMAQSLKANGIRIIAPIPGRGTIGIEVPNKNMQVVSMYSSVRSQRFQEMKAELPIVVGRTIQNESFTFDLAKMPHLLVAGATGQGKSVGLNAIITSLLYRKHPSQLKFVMIDPKMVEFSPYKSLEKHFMARMESEEDVIITDPKKAVYALNALCEEMEKRLKLLSDAEVRNVVEYNEKFIKRRLNPENGHFYMPYIVTIIDEFADLIMMDKGVEVPVMRLAQKARAIGIHLIVATQRPDVKVITGGIKANFPARIAFRVMQMVDSRTIIDQPGANQLIGRGDMLILKDGELTRVQCALVETEEVGNIVRHISNQQGYTEPYLLPDYTPDGAGGGDDMGESGAPVKYDKLFAEIARTAVSTGAMSTSAIQRNFEVGFNRAGRIMSQLENAGIVSRQHGSKPRSILFNDMYALEEKLQEMGLA